MMLTGHQPNYLPYPGFFEKVARADRFVVVDDVQFVKRGPFGWMHRNRIRTDSAQGWDWLSVPVLSSGRFTQKVREARITGRRSSGTTGRPPTSPTTLPSWPSSTSGPGTASAR
jgi:hypothetical protein